MQYKLTLQTALAAFAVTTAIVPARADTLTAVPMQGGMVMPMVTYRAEGGSLHVMMPPDVPQLTPLLVSHPGDHFDPADPWFDALDPERQGLSFSRRYGFVMDTMTDLLPVNTSIWIRKVHASTALSFYQYSGSEPKTWQPIFGTDGAPDALPWNGMMFHPGVTAPPGTNFLTAAFELYLARTDTGEELEGSISAPATLNWTNVSDGRPNLDISIKLVVAWSPETEAYLLETSDSADATSWKIVTNSPVFIDGTPAVVLDADAATQFFRMRKTP